MVPHMAQRIFSCARKRKGFSAVRQSGGGLAAHAAASLLDHGAARWAWARILLDPSLRLVLKLLGRRFRLRLRLRLGQQLHHSDRDAQVG